MDRNGTLTVGEMRSRALEEQLEETRKKLAETEAKLRLFIEDAPAEIAMFDMEMRYLAASHRFRVDYGLTQSGIDGVSHYEVFPDVPQRWREIHRRVLAGETLSGENEEFPRAGGRVDCISWKMTPWRRADGRVGGAILFSELLTERAAAARALTTTAQEFQALADNIPTLCWMAHANGDIYWYNRRWYEYTGTSPETQAGWGWESVHDPNVLPVVVEKWKDSLTTGNPFEMTFPLRGADGVFRPFLTRIIPVRGHDGTIIRWFGANIEIGDLKRAEERERLLAREVDHRAKNMLAVVQSMVQLSRADTVGDLKGAIRGRIQSLANAHNLLAASRWDGVLLKSLIEQELAPFTDVSRRLAVDCPELRLKPTAAQALALVLHELTTNAVKHGALSVPRGEVEVRCNKREDQAENLEISWRERHGPAVVTPRRSGFGSTIIRTSVENQLQGRVTMDWNSDGLLCTLTIPAEHVAESGEQNETVDHASAHPDAPAPIGGRRILVVEDEALVSIELQTALAAAGCELAGAATNVPDAIALIENKTVDAAILDINLAGERSFPVADMLSRARIPFIFCTGYADTMDMPHRFRKAPVLGKPFVVSEVRRALGAVLSDAEGQPRGGDSARP